MRFKPAGSDRSADNEKKLELIPPESKLVAEGKRILRIDLWRTFISKAL